MSTTSKGASRSGRAPKLRLSCDACAAAKVRCSKDQPQCERCAANASPCVYGPSRRSGKPPKDPNRQSVSHPDSKKTEYAASDNHSPPLHGLASRHSIQKDAKDDLDVTSGNTGPGWTTQLPHSFGRWNEGNLGSGVDVFGNASQFNTMEESMLINGPLLSRHNSGYSTDNSSNSPWQVDSTGVPFSNYSSSMAFPTLDFQDFVHTETLQSASPSTSASSTGFSSDYSFFNGHSTLQTPQLSRQNSCSGHDCYALAYSTLSSLHFQQPFPSASPSRPSSAASSRQQQQQQSFPSLDSVLRNNKVAIQNILQLLSCPCAADAHMALLYASITSKILIWYQVAAGITVSSSSPTAVVEHTYGSDFLRSVGMQGNVAGTQYSMGSTFADEPVKVGSFSPDDEYQFPMRQVLILGELGKAGVLIDALSRMHGLDDSDNEMKEVNSMVAPTGPARTLYASLGSWLKAELARTIEEVRRGSTASMRI